MRGHAGDPRHDEGARQNGDADLARLIAAAAEPLPPLSRCRRSRTRRRSAPASSASGRRVVLLGEATHGTGEFYRARAAVTRRLVERHGFGIVALDTDWPDAARLDRWVRDRPAAAHCGPANVECGAERIGASTIVWAAGVVASPAGAWIGADRDRQGRIPVGPDLTVPGHTDIFAVRTSPPGASARPPGRSGGWRDGWSRPPTGGRGPRRGRRAFAEAFAEPAPPASDQPVARAIAGFLAHGRVEAAWAPETETRPPLDPSRGTL